MKRIITVLAVAALMAVMMVATAVPAFAASEKGNCVGGPASNSNAFGKVTGDPGLGGAFVSNAANEFGGLGGIASADFCRPSR